MAVLDWRDFRYCTICNLIRVMEEKLDNYTMNDEQLLQMFTNIKKYCKSRRYCGSCKFNSVHLKKSMHYLEDESKMFEDNSACLIGQLSYELAKQPELWDEVNIEGILKDTLTF